MQSAERIFFGVAIGIAILLALTIFGRAMAQYAVFLSGSDEELEGGNTTVYNFDHTDSIEDILPEIDVSKLDLSR